MKYFIRHLQLLLNFEFTLISFATSLREKRIVETFACSCSTALLENAESFNKNIHGEIHFLWSCRLKIHQRSFPEDYFGGIVTKASWMESNNQGGYKTIYLIFNSDMSIVFSDFCTASICFIFDNEPLNFRRRGLYKWDTVFKDGPSKIF